MNIHPEPLDHMPILTFIQNKYANFVSSLYESKIKYSIGTVTNGRGFFNESRDRGTGFTINTNKLEAFHSTNKMDGIAEELANLAMQLERKVLTNSELNGLKDVDEDVQLEKTSINITDEGPWSENYEDEMLNLVAEVEHLLKDYKWLRYKIQIDTEFIQKRFQSTKFTDLIQEYSLSLLSISFFSKRDYYPIHRTEIIGGLNKNDLSWVSIEEKVDVMVKDFRKLIDATKPKNGKYDVILSPDTGYSLIHETVGHGCEADQVINNNSFLTNKLGYKVASAQLTVVDDPHIRGVGWSEFDDEGTKTQGSILIDEGILSSFLHNNKTAKIMGSRSTGNARATSYLSPPSTRQTNIYIEPKDFTLEELLEGVKNGILIGPTLSASTSIYTGEYSIESQISYEISNGEITKILGPTTINDNSFSTLNNISSIGRLQEKLPSICLKDDSMVYVGAVAPFIVVKGLNLV